MDIISEYGEKIAVFVILSVYGELLLPDNSYRKYIRLVMGAVLMSIVLEPFNNFLGR